MINQGMVINLKDDEWVRRQIQAGKAVSKCLIEFAKNMKAADPINLLDIEDMCEKIILDHGCTPTFLNYKPSLANKPFPGKVCLSVNKEVVHGIPKDYQLKNGDVVTLDLGATFEGAIADAAFTAIYGQTDNQKLKQMLIDCQKSLIAGINSVEINKKTGEIGYAIFSHAKTTPFGLITDFGGHGIDYNTLHANPFIDNKARKDAGVVIQPGLSIAIEPMMTLTKNTNSRVAKDDWTIVTKDLSCHYEHSVTIDPEGKLYIITAHDLDAKDYN